MTTPHLRLLRLLVENGALAADDLPRILDLLRAEGLALGQAVVRLDLLAPEDYARRAAACLRLPFFDLRRAAPRPRALALLGGAACRRLGALPVLAGGRSAAVAVAEPPDEPTKAELTRLLGRRVVVGLAAVDALDAAVGAAYPERPEVIVLDDPEDLGAVAAVHAALREAVRRRATHLHVEPGPDGVRLRLRIDGELADLERWPASLRRAGVARLKIMARLDIAERRRPQEGAFDARWAGGAASFEVSTAPLVGGEERVVVRRIDPAEPPPALDELGLAGLPELLDRPRGWILFAGPVREDRALALRAALRHLAARGRAVVRASDGPPEEGFAQAPTACLRALLRQDADVLAVDDLADADAAALLLRSAADRLTLAGVAADGAVDAFRRLREAGLDARRVEERAAAVVAVRRLRRLCRACRRPAPAPPGLRRCATEVFGPVGCAACDGRGYRGLLRIAEIVRPGRRFRSRALSRAALAALEAGETSFAEVRDLLRHGHGGIPAPP